MHFHTLVCFVCLSVYDSSEWLYTVALSCAELVSERAALVALIMTGRKNPCLDRFQQWKGGSYDARPHASLFLVLYICLSVLYVCICWFGKQFVLDSFQHSPSAVHDCIAILQACTLDGANGHPSSTEALQKHAYLLWFVASTVTAWAQSPEKWAQVSAEERSQVGQVREYRGEGERTYQLLLVRRLLT